LGKSERRYQTCQHNRFKQDGTGDLWLADATFQHAGRVGIRQHNGRPGRRAEGCAADVRASPVFAQRNRATAVQARGRASAVSACRRCWISSALGLAHIPIRPRRSRRRATGGGAWAPPAGAGCALLPPIRMCDRDCPTDYTDLGGAVNLLETNCHHAFDVPPIACLWGYLTVSSSIKPLTPGTKRPIAKTFQQKWAMFNNHNGSIRCIIYNARLNCRYLLTPIFRKERRVQYGGRIRDKGSAHRSCGS
jgi:hypothetical protein